MANRKGMSKLAKEILRLSKMDLPSQGKLIESNGEVYQFMIPSKKIKDNKKKNSKINIKQGG